MHYLLIYHLSEDYLERRAGLRDEHLALAWQAAERGELVLGGALTDPVDTSILVFSAESPEVPARFAEADPYVLNGLIRTWEVRPWITVVGKDAATPVLPKLG